MESEKSSSQIQREEIFMPFWNCQEHAKHWSFHMQHFLSIRYGKCILEMQNDFLGLIHNSAQKPFEALDRSFQVLRRNIRPFVNTLILLAEIFRQTSPVISRSSAPEEINAFLKSTTLWLHVKTLKLLLICVSSYKKIDQLRHYLINCCNLGTIR